MVGSGGETHRRSPAIKCPAEQRKCLDKPKNAKQRQGEAERGSEKKGKGTDGLDCMEFISNGEAKKSERKEILH